MFNLSSFLTTIGAKFSRAPRDRLGQRALAIALGLGLGLAMQFEIAQAQVFTDGSDTAAPIDPTVATQEGTSASYAQSTSPIGTAVASPGMSGPQGNTTSLAAATQTVTSPGRTAGQFSVSPTGGAVYNIPIWTPPGAREIEPHLALHYTSGGPDGPMGPGWSLTGFSLLARCNKTWAANGAAAGVLLSTADDLCLDGQRLRLTGGTQGVAGSTYQTEIANFSNVTAYGASGNGPSYFIVQGKDGRYYEYGNSSDSQIFASGSSTPYMWALNKVRDRQGNNMVFTYTTGNTTAIPSKIQYTATPGTGASFGYEVDFNYVTRTGGTTLTKYVGGGSVTQSSQLDNINVLSSGTSVRKYLLSYAASPTTNRPMLQSVQECGGSAGTDCLRPTQISYQSGAAGWSTTPVATGATSQYGSLPIDLNGDGIPDLLYLTSAGAWHAKLGLTSGGLGSDIVGFNLTGTSGQALPGNFSGLSQTQFLAPQSGFWWVYTYDSSSGAFSRVNTNLAVGTEMLAVDYDGDGLSDLVSYASGGGIAVRRNITQPGGAVTFASTAFTILTTTPQGVPSLYGARTADFNNDGRADLFGATNQTIGAIQIITWHVIVSNGFSAPATVTSLIGFNGGPQIGDWNGDGCSDIIGLTIYISKCDGTNFTSFSAGVPQTYDPTLVVDWDNDGQTDLLYQDIDPNTHAGPWYVKRSTGSNIAAAVPLGITGTSTQSFYLVDQNSDGQQDLAFTDSSASYAINYYPHAGVNTPPDLANSITEGFGINFSPTYAAISQSNYTKGTDAVFPEVDFQGPMYVVSKFTASDGTGGTYQNQFYYYRARLNLQGRGFEGFYSTRKWDNRNGLYTFEYYRRDFPYIGGVSEEDIMQPDAATLMQKTLNTYNQIALAGTGCSSRCLPYVASTTITKYEVGGTKNGNLISTAATNYTYDSYGNITTTNSVLTDNDAGSPFSGQQWTTVITNTITNNTANWCLGRPSSTTTQKTVPGPTTQTRRVDHTIDYAACRATSEIVEPTDSRLKVTTSFGFDGCGNTNSVSVVGLDSGGAAMPARTTTTSYGTRCQLPETVTNPLNQTTTTAYDYDFGLKSSVTDPNNIQVSWVYDNFGRKTLETRPDSTKTTWTYSDCVGSCFGPPDLRFLATETLLNASGATVRLGYKFYDGLDRLRYDEVQRTLGTWTYKQFIYDNLGRKVDDFRPYTSTTDGGYHQYTYDLADRVTADKLYESEGGALYRTISVTYLGQTVAVTDPNGNTIQKVTDVAGKIRRVIDPSPGGTTNYTFDSFGNLVTLVDAIGVTSTYTYNIRGFKTGAHDADTGVWSFTPDSLNELVSQTDANGNVTTFGYDLLGRMTSRTEPESSTPTSWVYGTSVSAHNIGHLQSVSKPDGYAESYAYDSVGRPQTTVYTEDGANYQFDYAYNNLGLPDTLTYPTNPAGSRFAAKYVYDSYGYLNATQNAATGTTFWVLGAVNDGSLPTSESLGNGIQVTSAYTAWTDEITSRSEGSGGSTNNLQNLSYSWDLNGNLKQRQDLRQGLTEIFTLDSLNRLTNSTLNGVQNLAATYDPAGDILSKSDVGAYTYGDIRHPHAVTAAGGWSMSYDANGNVNSRAGGAVSSYSYNLPNQINYNGNSAQFSYNSSHQRWKQVANYGGTNETVHYIGGMLEVVQRGTMTEFRHQIAAGSSTAIYVRRSDCSTSTYYATSDHLGSADLVMDNYGAVLARESFTPFGARRGSNWQGVPSASDNNVFTATTRKGFTGQEMLDAVSLVHMNGRVYDPFLGKFLSADSVVQSLGESQSVNPYSYAWNDPLRYIDPSGHSLLGDLIDIIVTVAVFIFAPELAPGIFEGELAATAFVAGFAGGFFGALVSTGDLGAALVAGVTQGTISSLAAGVAGTNWDIGEKVLAYVAVGCIGGEIGMSGNCGKGALSAAFALAAQPLIIKFPSLGVWGAVPETAEAGFLGGEAARLAGGKFEDGFTTAAAQYLVSFSPSNEKQTGSVGHQLFRDFDAIFTDVYAAFVGQIGAVIGFFQDIGRFSGDLGNGDFGKLGGDLWDTAYDLVIPHYGYYGGAGWGTRQFGKSGTDPTPLNQEDFSSFTHDVSCTPKCTGPANLGWVANSFSGNSAYLPPGVFGIAYKLIGVVPFETAGHF